MSDDTYRKLQKKAFAICRNAGLSRTDRLEFAKEFLKLEKVESFNDLSLTDMEDLCFGLEAWDTIQSLRMASGALLNEAQILVGRGAREYEAKAIEDEGESPVDAPESSSEDEIEDREPEESNDAESDVQEPQEDDNDDSLSPEIASEFASTRKSRKRNVD